MKIKFACPSCGKPHTVDASLAGRKGRCQDCGAVMRIPAPPKPEAAPAPAPADIYGLDDDPLPTAPAPSRGGSSASLDEDGGVLPGRSGPKPAKKGSKGKRRGAEGPWQLPLRNLAVQLIVLALIVSIIRVGLNSTAETRAAGRIASLVNMAIAIPAMILTVISVLGAAVSFAAGNRRAFSGEDGRSQAAWGWAIFQTTVTLFILFGGVSGAGRFGFNSFGRSLPRTEQVDLGTLQSMFETVVGGMEGTVMQIHMAPDPSSPDFSDYFTRLGGRAAEIQAATQRFASTPLPTRAQAEFLRTAYELRLIQVLEDMSGAFRSLNAKLEPLATDPQQRGVVDSMKSEIAKVDRAVASLRAVPRDDVARWYFTATTEDVGKNAPPPPPPGQAPEHILRQLREDQARSEAFRQQMRNLDPPAFGPGGQPPGPGGPPFGPGN